MPKPEKHTAAGRSTSINPHSGACFSVNQTIGSEIIVGGEHGVSL